MYEGLPIAVLAAAFVSKSIVLLRLSTLFKVSGEQVFYSTARLLLFAPLTALFCAAAGLTAGLCFYKIRQMGFLLNHMKAAFCITIFILFYVFSMVLLLNGIYSSPFLIGLPIITVASFGALFSATWMYEKLDLL